MNKANTDKNSCCQCLPGESHVAEVYGAAQMS